MPRYLIVCNQLRGDVQLTEYPDEQQEQALAPRFELEREHRLEPHIEVVILSASSRDVPERTHARYFKTVQQLVENA